MRALVYRPIAAMRLLLVLAVATGVLSCTAKLAPDYEKAIVDGLTSANEGAMTLFASVSSGAPKGTFAKREDSYNEVIGKFEAVRVQVATRPMPTVNPAVTRILAVGQGSDAKTIELPAAPTTEVVSKIARDLGVMRDADRTAGLPPMIVSGFKREYEISIQQALAYEKQLQR